MHLNTIERNWIIALWYTVDPNEIRIQITFTLYSKASSPLGRQDQTEEPIVTRPPFIGPR